MSRFTHFVHRITLAAVLNIAWSSAAHAQPAWVPTDIGTFGGSEAVARAVNNHGVVVGDSDLPGNSARHIFLWTAGDGMVDIGTMGGVTAYGMDINDAGQVVGFGDLAGGTHLHAFVWSAATGFTDICEGQAHAINNRGTVVGECVGRGPIMWTASEGIVNLGSIPGVVNGSYSATDVNEAGTVVGTVVTHAHIEDTIPRPFIWTRAGGMAFVGVGVEGGYGPYINNRGDIAMGFNLWPHDGGGRVFLGFPAGGLNNRGQIVEERSY